MSPSDFSPSRKASNWPLRRIGIQQILQLLIGCNCSGSLTLNETRSSCAKAARLKLQPGSSENNANVPVLLEVWHGQQPPQCRWSEAMPLHSRGCMEGGISCATSHCSGEMGGQQQNCPSLISSKSWLTATASNLDCRTWKECNQKSQTVLPRSGFK